MSIRLLHLRRISLVLCISFILICSALLPCFASDDSVPLSDLPTEVTVEPIRISPSNTSGFHAVILGLLGDYNPIAVTTAYQYPSGTGYTTRYQVDVEPDWSWISTAAIFVVIIFCLFRLVGGLFSCKR